MGLGRRTLKFRGRDDWDRTAKQVATGCNKRMDRHGDSAPDWHPSKAPAALTCTCMHMLQGARVSCGGQA